MHRNYSTKKKVILHSTPLRFQKGFGCILQSGGKIYPVKSLIWLCTQIQKQSPTCSKFLLESTKNNHILRQNLDKFSSQTILQGCSEKHQKNYINMYIFHLKNSTKIHTYYKITNYLSQNSEH